MTTIDGKRIYAVRANKLLTINSDDVILVRNSYKDYETGLAKMNLETLDERRENLCLSFARKCTKNKKLSHMFPLREKTHEMKTRKNEKYQVYKANNERYRNSAIIHMQHLLNSNM